MGLRITDRIQRKLVSELNEEKEKHIKELAGKIIHPELERREEFSSELIRKLRSIKKEVSTSTAAEKMAHHVEQLIKQGAESATRSQIPVDIATLLDLL